MFVSIRPPPRCARHCVHVIAPSPLSQEQAAAFLSRLPGEDDVLRLRETQEKVEPQPQPRLEKAGHTLVTRSGVVREQHLDEAGVRESSAQLPPREAEFRHTVL